MRREYLTHPLFAGRNITLAGKALYQKTPQAILLLGDDQCCRGIKSTCFYIFITDRGRFDWRKTQWYRNTAIDYTELLRVTIGNDIPVPAHDDPEIIVTGSNGIIIPGGWSCVHLYLKINFMGDITGYVEAFFHRLCGSPGALNLTSFKLSQFN